MNPSAVSQDPDRSLTQSIHELERHLIRLEGKLERMQIQTELRTWLILFSIPLSAVLLVIVLTGTLKP